MSYSRGYYGEREAQDALAVVAKWMGREKNLKVEYHGGTAVDADIFNGVIRIPRLAASNGLTEETINLLRGRVYHEAGHIFDADVLKKLKRIGKYPSGILFEIFNAVEDMRMERAVAERHAGAKPVFDWNAKYHNQKISEKMAEGEIDRPIWESLVAMMFQSAGMRPQWRLSEKAQKYFDDAYNKFTEWKKCQDSEDAYDLAEEIFEIMKQTHEQHQQEQEQSQESQNQNNEDQEQDQSEEQDGQGQGDNGGEDEQDQDGEGQGDDEGEEQDGQSEGSSKDFGDESADEDEQDGNGMESENDADQDVEQGGNSQGKSDDSDENGEAQDGEEETQEERDARLEEEMAEEAEGISLEEMQDADIAQAFDELEWEDRNYLADKSKDEHNVIEPQEHHMSRYMNERAEVSASVAGMANALLQALRARTRCKVNPYQKRGKIDNRQLVAIAKGLSKDVFYTTKQGEKLDTAVEIIIDESASMGGDDVRSCRRIALAVAEVLTQLNIPFEITGTTTKYMQGRSMPELHGGLDRTNPLVYNHYKTFEQGWHSVKHAIMQTGAHNHNVDGEAVEYCARRLMNRPEARKVVLSLSDGEPFAGHQNMSTMEENLKRSCARARENGVEVYGFGIGTHAPKAYYGAENFIHLPNRKMDTEFTKAFVKIVSGGQLFV
jgi:cobalamin biosynthesis protein CobT